MEPSIIKRERVRFGGPEAAQAREPAARNASRTTCRPSRRAELVTLAGVVHAIEVTCSCGEVTLVEVELAGAPKTPADEAGKEQP